MDFSSSIETIDDVTKKVSVAIPAARVRDEYNRAVSQLATSTQMKGFRQGKAPRKLVEQMHGERVKWDVAQDLVVSTLRTLMTENKLDVVGRPEVDFVAADPGSDFQFTAKVALHPAPTIIGYEKFEVKVPKAEVKDEQVQRIVDELRESKAGRRPLTDRTEVHSGDVIEGTVAILVDGESEEAPAEPVVTKVGAGKIPPDLDAGLIGMNIGEERVIPAVFGDDHPNPRFRSKKGSYRVKLSGLFEQLLPELDDQFAASIDPSTQTLLELRLKIRKQLEEETTREARSAVQAEILNQLVAGNQFLVPQVMVDEEIRSLLVRMGALDPQKYDPSAINVEPFREKLGETAAKRVRTSIIVDRIGEQESIKPENADIDSAIRDLATSSGVNEDEARRYLLQSNQAAQFSRDIARYKVLQFLEGRATVEYTSPA